MGYSRSPLACFACIELASITSTFSHTLPSAHPPSHPPRKPPTHTPLKSPNHPPVKPPSHPQVKPPSRPPVKPPTYPHIKPPTYPPMKPPTYPQIKPPTKPPTRRFLAVQASRCRLLQVLQVCRRINAHWRFSTILSITQSSTNTQTHIVSYHSSHLYKHCSVLYFLISRRSGPTHMRKREEGRSDKRHDKCERLLLHHT